MFDEWAIAMVAGVLEMGNEVSFKSLAEVPC